MGVVSGRSKYLQVSKPTYNAGVACARSTLCVLVPYKTLVNSAEALREHAIAAPSARDTQRHIPLDPSLRVGLAEIARRRRRRRAWSKPLSCGERWKRARDKHGATNRLGRRLRRY